VRRLDSSAAAKGGGIKFPEEVSLIGFPSGIDSMRIQDFGHKFYRKPREIGLPSAV
jgi:hypothetical protein